MGVKLNYSLAVLLSIAVIIPFLLIMIEPHNFVDYEGDFQEIESQPFDFSDTLKISEYILNLDERLNSNLVVGEQESRITQEQSQEVRLLIDEGLTWHRDYRYSSEMEEIDEYIATSLWYMTKANIFSEYYVFSNCVGNSMSIVDKYHFIFYFLKSEDKEEINYLNSQKEDIRGIQENLIRRGTVENLMSDAEYFAGVSSRLRKLNGRCETFYEKINKDYAFQDNFVKLKIFFILIWALGIFTLGKMVTLKGMKNIFSFLFKQLIRFNKGWNDVLTPEDVNDEAIKQILKLSPLITALASVTALFIGLFGTKSLYFVITGLTCVLFLLLSVIFGIASINSKNKTFRKICYYLFLFGLFLFIFFLFLIVFVVNWTNFVNWLKVGFTSLASTNSTA